MDQENKEVTLFDRGRGPMSTQAPPCCSSTESTDYYELEKTASNLAIDKQLVKNGVGCTALDRPLAPYLDLEPSEEPELECFPAFYGEPALDVGVQCAEAE